MISVTTCTRESVIFIFSFWMVCNLAAKYPGAGKRMTIVTIPTTALEGEIGGIRYGILKPVELIDAPPTQDSVQERNTKDDLDGAGDRDHKEIPSVNNVVQVSGDEVIDLPDEVSALLTRRLLILSLDARLVRLQWGGFGDGGCGGAFGNIGSLG